MRWILCLLPLFACGGQKPAAEKSAFDALSDDKKSELMAAKVVPQIGAILKEHDAAKFEKVGCATCHGPSKSEDPHKILPKLTLSNGGSERLAKTEPALMKLMTEKVAPTMGEILGEKNFGCSGCHTVQ